MSALPAAKQILLDGVIATGAGPARRCFAGASSFLATVKGTGSVAATVVVEALNANDQWVPIQTVTLSGTSAASDGFAIGAAFGDVRGRVSSISGAGAAVWLTQAA